MSSFAIAPRFARPAARWQSRILCGMLFLQFATALPVKAETLASASADALANYTSHKLATSDIDTARYAVDISRAGYLPNVALSGQYGKAHLSTVLSNIGQPDADYTPRTYGITLNQSLFDGFKTKNSVSRDVASLNASREQLRDTDQSIILSTITAYLEVMRQQQALQLYENEMSDMRAHLRESMAKIRAGLANETERFQDEAALSNAESQASSASALLDIAKTKYKNLTGHEPRQLVLPALPLGSLPRSLSEAIATGRNLNPALRAAQHNQTAANAAVGVATASHMPTLDLNVVAQRQYDPISLPTQSETTTYGASLQLNIPLYQGGAVQANVRRATSLASKQQVAYLQTRDQLEVNITEAWEKLQGGYQLSRALSAEADASARTLKGVEIGVQIGERSNRELIDQRSNVLDVRTRFFNAQCDQLIYAYKLMEAMGILDMPHMMSPGNGTYVGDNSAAQAKTAAR